MWTQIVGKTRLVLSPPQNHWWHAALYVTARGLTTSTIPTGNQTFEVQFDFVAHQLSITTSTGGGRSMFLFPRSVADFYAEYMACLRSFGIEVGINLKPQEFDDTTPFDEDDHHASYDREAIDRFHRVLINSDRVLKEFRSRFIGKCSPVHFFWGSFDLAVTRFSGRRAPEREGADGITREAYSHEVSSVGFWPGGGSVTGPAFYSYAAPEPKGFREAKAKPDAARYDEAIGEFLVMYDDVRAAGRPCEELLAFCHSTYEAAANAAGWDRRALERAG
jgi:Family of unknown function (DUF5996)